MQAAQLLDKEHFHDTEILGQLPGKMVVIRASNIGLLTIMLCGPGGLILLILVLRANRG